MSYNSMTLRNVMGGCELVDLKPPNTEKSLLIDLSLIGVNLHELQRNLISNTSHNQNNDKDGVGESVSTAAIGSEFRGGSCDDHWKDNSNVCNAQHIADNAIKNIADTEPTDAQCSLELFDLNANKIVEAEPSDLPQPVFSSIQNFYETFDVSDQIESMMEMENIADTPSSTSTFDSSYDRDLTIYETSIVYHQSLEDASNVTLPATESQNNELYFIPNLVVLEDSTHSLLEQKITNWEVRNINKSSENLELKEKKRKPTGRLPRKKPSVEKNISCSRCSKKFRTAAHMKVHFMVHMDSECVHLCTVCERRFCHRGALTLHARKHAPRSAFGIPL